MSSTPNPTAGNGRGQTLNEVDDNASIALAFWRHIYGSGGDGQRVALFSGVRADDGRLTTPWEMSYSYPAEANDAIQRIAEWVKSGRDVFQCAHLLTERKRVKEHAAHFAALYVDSDGAPIPENLPAPTAVIQSSPGRGQLYWRLTRPVAPEIGEQLNKRLAYQMDADPSGWDRTQLLRIPGTPNRKYPDAPTVTIIRQDDSAAYDPDELHRVLPHLPSHTQRLDPEPNGRIPEGSRNVTLASIGGTLRSRGLGQSVIVVALLEANRVQCNPPLGDDEVRAIAQSIAKYPAGEIASPEFSLVPKQTANGRAATVTLDQVVAEDVDWLWPGRIPFGKLTVIDGDPGLGKSLVTLDLAARVTSGRGMPDGTFSDLDGPETVVLITVEDGLADTIRPRLDLAGAVASRVVAITGIADEDGVLHPVTLPDHWDQIRTIVVQHRARLIILDPLMALLGGAVNSFRDQDVRRALTPGVMMAEETRAALLVVRHLNKGTGSSAIYRGGGSIGIIGAARSGLLVAKDPDDDTDTRRIMARTKGNLAPPVPALLYTVEAAGTHPRIKWGGATTHTADFLLAGNQRKPATPEREEILVFLAGSDTGRTPQQVASALDKSESTVRTLLRKMAEAGDVIQPKYGVYDLPSRRRIDSVDSADSSRTNQGQESIESIESTSLRPTTLQPTLIKNTCADCGEPCGSSYRCSPCAAAGVRRRA